MPAIQTAAYERLATATAADVWSAERRIQARRAAERERQEAAKPPPPRPVIKLPPPPKPEPIAPTAAEAVAKALQRTVPNTGLTIQSAVSNFYGVSVDDLTSPRRLRHIVRARQVAMYLLHRLSRRTLHEIGRMFRRDHSTAFYANELIAKRRLSDAKLDGELRDLETELARGLSQ